MPTKSTAYRRMDSSSQPPACASGELSRRLGMLGSRRGWSGRQALWELVEHGVLLVAPEPTDWTRVAQLMGKYRDTPMALADAQLMPVVDEMGGPPKFTLDSHFTI